MSFYDAHLFICTNRKDKGACCAAKGSEKLRDETKHLAKQRRFGKRVRVNASGCLGRCEEGVMAVLYPQNQWKTGLSENDAESLVQWIAESLDRS